MELAGSVLEAALLPSAIVLTLLTLIPSLVVAYHCQKNTNHPGPSFMVWLGLMVGLASLALSSLWVLLLVLGGAVFYFYIPHLLCSGCSPETFAGLALVTLVGPPLVLALIAPCGVYVFCRHRANTVN